MLIRLWRIVSPLLLLVFASVAVAQSVVDSSSNANTSAMQGTNCSNIEFPWYAAGTMPTGSHKAGSSCVCDGNKTINAENTACGCSANTYWDTGWSTCHATCEGGKTWDGAQCSCPSGSPDWNGSSCGSKPAFSSFSSSPTTQTVGAGNFGLSWNTSNASSTSVACSGVNPGSFSGGVSGSGTVPAQVPGRTTCTATANNSWGNAATFSIDLIAECPAGTSDVGGVCGSQATNSTFTVSPSVANPGGTFQINWQVQGVVTRVMIACSGASNGSFGPLASSGNTSIAAAALGPTSCEITATNPWGDAKKTVTVNTECPPGQSNFGGTCGSVASNNVFTASPSSANPGGSFQLSWQLDPTVTSATITCTGASNQTYTLASTSGQNTLAAAALGSTNCEIAATNNWGTAKKTVTVSTDCPSGTSNVSGACRVVCPSGQTENGTSGVCGSAPSGTSLSVSPAVQEINGTFTFGISGGAGATSFTLDCGANGSSSISSSGGTRPAGSVPGVTKTCSVIATNAWGSAGSNTVTTQTSCPAGQTDVGGSCAGAQPSAVSLSISPITQEINGTFTVTPSGGNGATSLTLDCGAAGSSSLSFSGGTLAAGPTPNVTTTCKVIASNTWGSTTSNAVTMNTTCPSGQSASGSSCALSPTSTSPGGVVSGKTFNLMMPYGKNGGNWLNAFEVTGLSDQIQIKSTMSGAVCSLTGPGSVCAFNRSSQLGGNAEQMAVDAFNDIWVDDTGGGRGYEYSSRTIRMAADGSLVLYSYYSGDGASFIQSNMYAYLRAEIGTLSVNQMTSIANGSNVTWAYDGKTY